MPMFCILVETWLNIRTPAVSDRHSLRFQHLFREGGTVGHQLPLAAFYWIEYQYQLRSTIVDINTIGMHCYECSWTMILNMDYKVKRNVAVYSNMRPKPSVFLPESIVYMYFRRPQLFSNESTHIFNIIYLT